MAHHKSAKKRIRSNETRRIRRRTYISSVKTAITTFKKAIEKNSEKDEVKKLFVKAQSLVSKASAKGMLHRNKASREVSNLSKLMKKFEAPAS